MFPNVEVLIIPGVLNSLSFNSGKPKNVLDLSNFSNLKILDVSLHNVSLVNIESTKLKVVYAVENDDVKAIEKEGVVLIKENLFPLQNPSMTDKQFAVLLSSMQPFVTDFGARDCFELTILNQICTKGFLESLKVYKQIGAPMEFTGNGQQTSKDYSRVRYPPTRMTSVSYQRKWIYSPFSSLSFACFSCKPEIINFLIEQGSDLTGKPGLIHPLSVLFSKHVRISNQAVHFDYSGSKPEGCVALEDWKQVITLLVKKGVDLNTKLETFSYDSFFFQSGTPIDLFLGGQQIHDKNQFNQTLAFLLNLGASVEHCLEPFLYASPDNELIDLLVLKNAKVGRFPISSRDSFTGLSGLVRLMNLRQDFSFLRKAIQHLAFSSQAGIEDNEGNNPLHWALSFISLKYGAEKNFDNAEALAFLKDLIDLGVSPLQKNKRGICAALFAFLLPSLPEGVCLQILLTLIPSLPFQAHSIPADDNGWSVIHAAASMCDSSSLEQLLSWESRELSSVDKTGTSPLLSLFKQSKLDDSPTNLLFSSTNRIELMKRTLNVFAMKDVDLNVFDDKKRSFWHYLALSDTNNGTLSTQVFEHLFGGKTLKSKVCEEIVNMKDYLGNTALSYASQKGNNVLVELLFKLGADLDMVDERNRDALVVALQTYLPSYLKKENDLIVKEGIVLTDRNSPNSFRYFYPSWLLEEGLSEVSKEKGVSLDGGALEKDPILSSPDFYEENLISVCEFLVEKSGNLNRADSGSGRDAVSLLASIPPLASNPLVTQKIRKLGSKCGERDYSEMSPLHYFLSTLDSSWTISNERFEPLSEFVKCLLERGASANIKNHLTGEPALSLACRIPYCLPQTVQHLIDYGADVLFENPTSKGNVLHTVISPIFPSLTAKEIQTKKLGILLEKKELQLDVLDSNGHTPLLLAVKNGLIQSAVLLLEEHKKGRNVGIDFAENSTSWTSLHYAASFVEKCDKYQMFLYNKLVEAGASVNVQDKKGRRAQDLLLCGMGVSLDNEEDFKIISKLEFHLSQRFRNFPVDAESFERKHEHGIPDVFECENIHLREYTKQIPLVQIFIPVYESGSNYKHFAVSQRYQKFSPEEVRLAFWNRANGQSHKFIHFEEEYDNQSLTADRITTINSPLKVPLFGSRPAVGSFGGFETQPDQHKDQQPTFGTFGGFGEFGAFPQRSTFGGLGAQPDQTTTFGGFGAQLDQKKDEQPTFGTLGGFGAQPDQKKDEQPTFGTLGGFGSQPDQKKDQQPTFGTLGGFGSQPDQKKDQQTTFGGFGAQPDQQPTLGGFGAQFDQKKDERPTFGTFGGFGAQPAQKKDKRPTFGTLGGFGSQPAQKKGQQPTFGTLGGFGSQPAAYPFEVFNESSTNQEFTFGKTTDEVFKFGTSNLDKETNEENSRAKKGEEDDN